MAYIIVVLLFSLSSWGAIDGQHSWGPLSSSGLVTATPVARTLGLVVEALVHAVGIGTLLSLQLANGHALLAVGGFMV